MSTQPTLAELTRVFGRIGVLSFGGSAAQIALMHRVLVDERQWLTEDQFLRALSFCMLLPGPEAMQLCTYCGWKLRGVSGGLLAGWLFVGPGAIVIAALAVLYVSYGDLPLVQALFLGVQAAVVAIVVLALIRLSRKALTTPLAWTLAGLAFVALFAAQLPFPVVLAAAAGAGLLFSQPRAPLDPVARPLDTRTGRTLAVWLAIWLAPLGLCALLAPGFLTQLAGFFAWLAIVTFGGAYAVLAYMTQAVVSDFGWLSTAQMIDALGLAETTPGPLILVTQFVGFLAGFGHGGIGLGVVAMVVTLWMTFAPSFLFIFVGAPYLEWLTAQPRLSAALSAITAAVVGVILNLSLWFGLHVVFGTVGTLDWGGGQVPWPAWKTVELLPLALALAAGALLWRGAAIGTVIGISAVLGLLGLVA